MPVGSCSVLNFEILSSGREIKLMTEEVNIESSFEKYVKEASLIFEY